MSNDYFAKKRQNNQAKRRGRRGNNAAKFAGLSREPHYRVPREGAVRLFWWNGKGGRNFGDALSRFVVRAVTGRAVVRGEEGPKLVAIGSVLRLATPGDIIWGAGLSRPSEVSCGLDIRAVRGPMTRAEALRQGRPCPEVYGDPGLLVPRIWDTSGVKKDIDVGVLPHFVDQERAKQLSPGAHMIDVLAPVPDVIREVARCKLLYSSSLHGVITAEALGVPAIWVEYSDGVIGGGFKFRDYYASTGRKAPAALDWRGRADPSPTRDPIDIEIPDLDALVRACPGGTNGPVDLKSLRRIRL